MKHYAPNICLSLKITWKQGCFTIPIAKVGKGRFPKAKKKYKCVFQVSALKKLGMVGWHNGITFYFVKIFYIEIAFFNTFSPIFQQI